MAKLVITLERGEQGTLGVTVLLKVSSSPDYRYGAQAAAPRAWCRSINLKLSRLCAGRRETGRHAQGSDTRYVSGGTSR